MHNSQPSPPLPPHAEVSEGVPPQVAEAMLMQSPLATSLLQSFLATSLWFGSPDNNTQKRKQNTNTKQKQQHQVGGGGGGGGVGEGGISQWW